MRKQSIISAVRWRCWGRQYKKYHEIWREKAGEVKNTLPAFFMPAEGTAENKTGSTGESFLYV